MRLVFVHDGPIYYDKQGKYYEYAFHNLYERYSYLADEIIFLMRTYPLTSNTKYDEIPEEIQVVGFENFKSPTLYFKNKGKVSKIIEEEIRKANIAILRDSSAAHIALKYVKQYNVPYIWECVGYSWDAMWNHSFLGKMLAPRSLLIQRRSIKSSPYVYYVTDKFLQRKCPTTGKSIGCSDVVIDDIGEQILQNRLRKIENTHKETEIVVGTAAAIDVRYKGQEYVIKAIRLLKRRGLHIKYYLAGGNKSNSHYLEECAKKFGVEEDVVFLGSLDKDAVIKFYDSLDIYIQPSKQEGLPRSVIEAMSRGCPVLGTNIGGIPELLDVDCLFKKGSSKSAAEAIEKMVQSDMGAYAQRNFDKAKEYTSDKLTKKRERFYNDFLSEYFEDGR